MFHHHCPTYSLALFNLIITFLCIQVSLSLLCMKFENFLLNFPTRCTMKLFPFWTSCLIFSLPMHSCAQFMWFFPQNIQMIKAYMLKLKNHLIKQWLIVREKTKINWFKIIINYLWKYTICYFLLETYNSVNINEKQKESNSNTYIVCYKL